MKTLVHKLSSRNVGGITDSRNFAHFQIQQDIIMVNEPINLSSGN